MKRLLLIAGALLLALTGTAQTQGRGPVRHTQSDGRILSYVATGTRPNIYAQTLDGYTLWHTATGDIVYATTDSTGQMVPSTVLAADQRTAEEEAFLGTLPKGLRFLDIPSPLKAGHLLGGNHFPHTATENDSLLVILVQFQDVQFTNPAATFDSMFSQPGYDSTGSFKDYYRDQSGGMFSPGVRVVGPVTMPRNKDYYNQTSIFINYALQSMVTGAISQSDQYIDYSHYDNDNNGVVDAVLIFYAGKRPESKTQGLWPHHSTITNAGAHDGKTFSSYAIFDEGESGMPTIGVVCHEFGHCLGLPDLYDVAHDGTGSEEGRNPGVFSLMASGNYNGDKKLPPNLSVLEKSLLSWGAQFDTLQPGDSISLLAIGTANDRACYLPIDGDEFYAFEVRNGTNHWDAGIGMGEGGLIVYHGKESKLNTTSNGVINCTVGDEGWYVVPATDINKWDYSTFPFGSENNQSHLTPISPAKPMKNDSTVVDSIWITNIRWTSDSTMAFGYSKSRPNYTIVDNIPFNNGTDVTDSGFTASALVIGYADTLLAKGIVYATTPEACTMEQGMVVYDTTQDNDDSVRVTVGGISPGSHWFRAFVQDSSGITLTEPQKVISQLVKVDSVVSYIDTLHLMDTNIVRTWYLPYVSLNSNCNLIYTGGPANPDNISGMYPTQAMGRYDVDGPLGADESTERMLFAVSTEGDTVCYRFDLSAGAVMREAPTQQLPSWPNNVDGVDNSYTINGHLVVKRMLTMPEDMSNIYRADMVASVPNDTLQRWIEYYGPMRDNNCFIRHLQDYIIDSSLSAGDTIVLPTDDSTLVIMWDCAFGLKGYSLYTSAIVVQDSTNDEMPHASANISSALYRYCTDSTMRINLYDAHHFSILYGKHSELAALGVTDTATAVAYCMAHPDLVPRYEQYSTSYRKRNADFSLNEYSIPTFEPVTNYFTNLANSDSGQYDLYVVPFDYEGHRGEVGDLQFPVLCGELVRIEPGASNIPDDTTWFHLEAGQLVWKWHFESIEHGIYQHLPIEYMPIDSVFSGVFLAGELDDMMSTHGVDENDIMPLLRQQGRLNADDYVFDEDTIGLTADTIYEACLWTTLKNEETGWRDTLLVRRNFSTHVSPDIFVKAKVIAIESAQSNGCWIDCNINTAYVKTVFGTLEQLQNAGVTSMAAAKDYIEGGGSLSQTINIMGNGSSSSGDYGHAFASFNISTGQYYRLYVFPFDIDSIVGYGRMIGIDNRPESLPDCYTDPASDIGTTSANIHGHLSRSDYEFGDNYNGLRTKAGFFWRKASATDYDTIVVNEWDTTLNYTLNGLSPNTEYVVRAFYDHYGNYFNGNWSWGDMTFYSQNEITFTTAQCTVSASIDTTICYNAYYGNHRYTASQTLEHTYTAVNGCDSLLTVNLTVLPQRIGYDTVVLCYGEEYDGAARYGSTTLTETIQEEGLCDSTHIMRLDVLPQITATVRDTLRGGSYEWGGEVLTEPGQYTQVFTAANGCDSTVTLTLVAEPQEPHDGISDVDIEQIHIIVDGQTIVVSGAEGQMVTVYDAAGRLLATRRGGIRFEAPVAGAYLVQVGDKPERRFVAVR